MIFTWIFGSKSILKIILKDFRSCGNRKDWNKTMNWSGMFDLRISNSASDGSNCLYSIKWETAMKARNLLVLKINKVSNRVL